MSVSLKHSIFIFLTKILELFFQCSIKKARLANFHSFYLFFSRSAFRSALLELISTEHSNLFGKRGRPNGTILGTQRQELAEWKFATLDKDRDGDLTRSEVRGWWREAVR